MINRPHIVLYSHDTFGLGHLRRNLAISHRLAADYPLLSQLLLTGSPFAHRYEFPAELDYVKMPAVQKRPNGQYGSRTLDLGFSAMMQWRAQMILQAVREFEPEILLVDKAPAGMRGELRPTLEFIKRERPTTRLVFGMRDIIDAPEATRREWTRDGIYNLLEETYDAILLYGSRSFFDPVREYGLAPRAVSKLTECGHILRTEPIRPREEVLEEIRPLADALMVVTPGGGGDGVALVRSVIEMLLADRRDGRPDYHALVVTGPLMSKHDRDSLELYAGDDLPLTILDFTTDMLSYLNAADVVVSMGGYNTVCEILSLRQRAVLVPRVQVRREQLIRAEALAARHQVRVIHPAELTPTRLRAEVDLALASPRPNPERAGIDMKGLDRISTACADLLGLVWPRPARAASMSYPSGGGL